MRLCLRIARCACAILLVPRPQDFAGQKLAEDMYTVTITLFSAVGFVAGYLQGCVRRAGAGAPSNATARQSCGRERSLRRARSFRLMMEIFGAGVALSLLLCVPPWPFLNRHPLRWLQKPEGGVATPGAAQGGGGGGGGGGGRGGGKNNRGGGKGGKRCASQRSAHARVDETCGSCARPFTRFSGVDTSARFRGRRALRACTPRRAHTHELALR